MGVNYRDKIEDEVIVDCYDDYEVASGWSIYLEENMTFPFKAKMLKDYRRLKEGDEVKVLGLANEEDEDYFNAVVEIESGGNYFDIKLLNIESIDANKETTEVIEVWRYWKEKY